MDGHVGSQAERWIQDPSLVRMGFGLERQDWLSLAESTSWSSEGQAKARWELPTLCCGTVEAQKRKGSIYPLC